MRGLLIKKQIELTMSADDWELYTCSMTGCEIAARAINEAIQESFNAGETMGTVCSKAIAVMKQYSEYGAMDSEPIYHLDCILDELFSTKANRRGAW